jgi:uncharacterized protein
MSDRSDLPEDVRSFTLKTGEGKHIAVKHYQRGGSAVVILAHGFFNNQNVYLFKKMALDLYDRYDVVTFDFRGHGASDGLFGWTSKETEEMDLVLSYVREHGYRNIGLLGFSLGGAQVLIAASEHRDIDSVIAVSPPFDFWQIDFHFWEPEMLNDLKLNIGFKGVGKGIRPGNPFGVKIRPLDVVDAISPTPVLFIHGERDWLIKPRHSERLYQRAREPKRLVLIPRAGHAEKIYDTDAEEFFGLCVEEFDRNFQ